MAYSSATRTAMAEAIKSLMNERPFAKISVGDICEHCGMNRKTFYYHFRDKYDLVNWVFQTEFLEMTMLRSYTSGWELLGDICRYLYSERAFYTNALQIEGQNSFHDFFASFIGSVLPEVMRDRFSSMAEPQFFIEFYTDAIEASIIRWLRHTPVLPPDEFMQKLESVISTGRET